MKADKDSNDRLRVPTWYWLLVQETVDRAALDALVEAHDAARPLLPVQVKSGT